MTTTTEVITTTSITTEYRSDLNGWIVLVNGEPARNRFGSIRVFATSNGARKHATRERAGDMHR